MALSSLPSPSSSTSSSSPFIAGMRLWWSGDTASIPTGWEAVTDAAGRFIVSTGGTFTQDAKGGDLDGNKLKMKLNAITLVLANLPKITLNYKTTNDQNSKSIKSGSGVGKCNRGVKTGSLTINGSSTAFTPTGNVDMPSYFVAGILIEYVG